MRYNQIREMDVSNGEGIGVALFVQGCHFHCKNCFNSETWDFNSGHEWTQEVEDKFIELASKPYIQRVSILGGEPLADENINDVLNLVNRIHLSLPQKSIWLYTGYTWEQIFMYNKQKSNSNVLIFFEEEVIKAYRLRQNILKQCDVMVDGRYIDSERDITLAWRGSKNQKVIDVQQSIQKGEVVLWETH